MASAYYFEVSSAHAHACVPYNLRCMPVRIRRARAHTHTGSLAHSRWIRSLAHSLAHSRWMSGLL